MTPGLPGTGIGGLFYVLSALFMPFIALARCARRRGQGAPWRLIAGQWAMVMGILGALTAESWLIAKGVEGLDALRLRLSASHPSSWGRLFVGDAAPSAPAADAALSMTIYLSLTTLLGVLLAVHVLRLVLRSAARLRSAPPLIRAEPGSADSCPTKRQGYAARERACESAQVTVASRRLILSVEREVSHAN